MELSVAERITLLGLLPAQGSLTTLRIVQDLRQHIGFTEAEIADFGIQEVNDDGEPAEAGQPTRVIWRRDAPAREIEIGRKAEEIIVKALEKLDKAGELEERHLSLCDKFRFGSEA